MRLSDREWKVLEVLWQGGEPELGVHQPHPDGG